MRTRALKTPWKIIRWAVQKQKLLLTVLLLQENSRLITRPITHVPAHPFQYLFQPQTTRGSEHIVFQNPVRLRGLPAVAGPASPPPPALQTIKLLVFQEIKETGTLTSGIVTSPKYLKSLVTH